ncbi:MAG: hypothetical protein NC112_05090 [Oxalobacter formigenes]|nr:hypothetical protein [Oxalobacter formigenes]
MLGIRQSGRAFEITGTGNIEKPKQDFFSALRSGKFNIPLFATPRRYEIGGKNILASHLPPCDTKPVCFGKPENTFTRIDSGNQRAAPQKVMAMLRNQPFGIQSQKTISGTHIDTLSCGGLIMPGQNPCTFTCRPSRAPGRKSRSSKA